MRQRDKQAPQSAGETVRDIRRATRRHFSAEEKIRIVLEGLRGEDSIAELCRKEGIAQNLYYRWSKEFLEAGKKRSQATPRSGVTFTGSKSQASVAGKTSAKGLDAPLVFVS
jgi:transposase-like protein